MLAPQQTVIVRSDRSVTKQSLSTTTSVFPNARKTSYILFYIANNSERAARRSRAVSIFHRSGLQLFMCASLYELCRGQTHVYKVKIFGPLRHAPLRPDRPRAAACVWNYNLIHNPIDSVKVFYVIGKFISY